jgi:hypothetical protein
MAIIHIEPDDLSPAQAQQVLAVLNQASSAAQLAAQIELPGEPDIGIKLAERLLQGRAAAGGQFTQLSQVAAVPLIGPERFTDLCSAVLGLGRRELLALPQIVQLQQRLNALEALLTSQTPAPSLAPVATPYPVAAAVGAAGVVPQPTLRIAVQPASAWLGQAIQVQLSLLDAQGLPLANRLLTVSASQGLLQASFGYAQQVGEALQVRTGADGMVRLQLSQDTTEPLTQNQRFALQAALADMDVSASTPEAIRAQFDKLADDYDDERNVPLRQALDIYARDGQACLQRLNAGNPNFEWPVQTVLLRADLHEDDASQRVQTSAVAMASFKSWLAAWFTFLHDWLSRQAQLAAAFDKSNQSGGDASVLVERILSDAHRFVASQKGVAAELVSQQVVGQAITRFLSQRTPAMSDETKQALFPSLEIASQQIRAGNRGTLSVVSETRKAITRDVNQTISTRLNEVAQINTGVLTEMRSLHADMVERSTAVNQRLTAFDTNFQAFSNQFNTFSANVKTFNVDYAQFNLDRVKVGTQIGQFNTDLAGFQTQRVQITQDMAVIKTDVAGMNLKLNNINAGGVVVHNLPTRPGG